MVSSLLASAFFAWTASSPALAHTSWGGFFGGLPFALPPVGELRFVPPAAVDVIDSPTLDATEYGPACAQMNDAYAEQEQQTSVTGLASEDSLPVMVWIYGGGFSKGQTSTYNGMEIVVQSAIRGEEAARRGALNLGLKDQLAGLERAQKNVCTFGGDPTTATIFGQSAGAISIADLFLHSKLENLVRAAIFESGSQGTLPFFNATYRQPTWDALTALLPTCAGFAPNDTFAFAREANTDALLTAWTQSAAELPAVFLWAPVIDGPDGLIPDLPSRLIVTGKFSKIPFISGTNLDEGTPQRLNSTTDLEDFLFLMTLPFTSTAPKAFKVAVTKLLDLYPSPVAHKAEVPYVYGEDKLESSNVDIQLLSSAMLDYWLSFATSLTPNDGKGTPRTTWPQYKPAAQNIVQFDTTAFGNLSFANFAVVPDTYRVEQIAFIRSVAGDLSQ
ncbi:Alpha/Beta hydrolase protein [Epithele typhae]|uniref:Alpha/Beta hydrolase protein n=1 Tax=Epithele typhae TaxID=378194 RepID=UPI002008B4C9|nr:Alpha/Beta hydrolase protein [Epithele typhae]KAH9916614.1 Alpha/Beta hydrolase protein [Epithele typhae]